MNIIGFPGVIETPTYPLSSLCLMLQDTLFDCIRLRGLSATVRANSGYHFLMSLENIFFFFIYPEKGSVVLDEKKKNASFLS